MVSLTPWSEKFSQFKMLLLDFLQARDEPTIFRQCCASCKKTKTVVRTVYGNSNGFEVKVGMHQGSALSPLLFVIACSCNYIRQVNGVNWRDIM